MPVTFNLFRVRRFPAKPDKQKTVIFQTGTAELYGKPAQTSVAYEGADKSGRFETYLSKHEVLKKVEGRLYDGREFHEYFKKNEVTLVLQRSANLYCRSSGTVAKDLIDQLNDSYKAEFRADYMHIDFEAIRPQINEMNGIWISQINQPNLDTFAMFGAEVDRSQLYAELNNLGHASAILIRQQISGVSVPLIVSSRGSISFPQPAAQDEQIERALHLADELLKKGLIEVDSKRTVKEKRDAAKVLAKAAAFVAK